MEDLRPLLLLENARSLQPNTVQADLVSDLDRRFHVDHERAITGARLRAHQATGERGPSLEAGRIDPLTRRLVERHLAVEEDGTTTAARIRAIAGVELRNGAPLELFAPGSERASCRVLAEPERGALVLSCLSSEGEEVSRLELGPRGLRVTGDVVIEGKLVQLP